MQRIQGTYQDSVGQLIAGYFSKDRDYPVVPPYSAIGWIKDVNNQLKVIGQCIFINYTGSNIEFHANLPHCLSRQVIKDVYSYIFKQLNCNRATVKIPTDNKSILQLMSRLGFEYECTMHDYYGEANSPIDAVQYKLTKNNAMKWLQ